MNINHLSISWSTSRGRDTYGYNICRLDDRNNRARFKCMGGGYDMMGTVFGQWMQENYQDRLLKIADKFAATQSKADGYKSNNKTLYGGCYHLDDGRISLDGACGIESMMTIAKAIGLDVERTWDKKGHTTGYYVSDKPTAGPK